MCGIVTSCQGFVVNCGVVVFSSLCCVRFVGILRVSGRFTDIDAAMHMSMAPRALQATQLESHPVQRRGALAVSRHLCPFASRNSLGKRTNTIVAQDKWLVTPELNPHGIA